MKRSTPKKKIIIICCIVLSLAVLLNVVVLCYDVFNHRSGVVTKISAKTAGLDKIELRINYVFPIGGYSVREVPVNEGEYASDGMIDYDGSLGKYRIMVEFGDMELSTALLMRLQINNILKISPLKLQMKIACPSDHGFVLYIGSDSPIHVDPVKGGEFDPLADTIVIPITLNDA